MSFDTRVGSPNNAGAMVPYTQPGQVVVGNTQQAVDVYVSTCEDDGYRFADGAETARLRADLLEILDYYAEHQFLGWAVLFTKSSVAERLRDLIRDVVECNILFAPEDVFNVLEVHETRHVKSRKHHWQNLIVDRKKEQTEHQRDSAMELEVLRIWAKCVDEITHDVVDNANARAVCDYTWYLIDGAQEVLKRSNGNWTKKMASRFENLSASMAATRDNNEVAWQQVWGG